MHKNDREILLGFSNGTIMIYDWRNRKCFQQLSVPYMDAIGDISWSKENNIYCTFGCPGYV